MADQIVDKIVRGQNNPVANAAIIIGQAVLSPKSVSIIEIPTGDYFSSDTSELTGEMGYIVRNSRHLNVNPRFKLVFLAVLGLTSSLSSPNLLSQFSGRSRPTTYSRSLMRLGGLGNLDSAL